MVVLWCGDQYSGLSIQVWKQEKSDMLLDASLLMLFVRFPTYPWVENQWLRMKYVWLPIGKQQDASSICERSLAFLFSNGGL